MAKGDEKESAFVGTAFVPHAITHSEFTNIHLSADVQMNPVPLKSQDAGATRTQSETLPISQPAATLHLAQEALFMELEFGFPGIENLTQQNWGNLTASVNQRVKVSSLFRGGS